MDYDVVIVGGRPAGASLAARLGARGVRTLVVDRATFPSPPAVPSSPVIYPSAMRILDELGIDEAGYADDHARMRGFRMEVAGRFAVDMKVPRMSCGRDYVYGADRAVFDELLWRHLGRLPAVARRPGFTVTDVLRDGERVIGIVGGERGGPRESITAGAVIGADGRFSLIARRVGADEVEARNEHTSTVYYADWEGAAPLHPDGPVGYVYATARGLDVIFFAMPGGRVCVNTHARSDRVDVGGDAERYYHDTLRGLPGVWRTLERAERVSPLLGVKKIANGYRRPAGAGWALVGDAVHYKDPVDGQGIYDALVGARLLDQALAAWQAGESTWEAAMAAYRRALWEATHPMFLATTGRLERELYQEPPALVIDTLMRWTLSDPAYQATFLRVLSRDRPPAALTSRRGLLAAAARGIGRDLRGLVARARGRARK